MTKAELTQRIAFLIRVVRKEIQHLEYSAEQVFKQSITTENLTELIENPSFAVNLEAFTSRFSRLQDTVNKSWIVNGLKLTPL